MNKRYLILFYLLLVFCGTDLFAQVRPRTNGKPGASKNGDLLDSLRKREEGGQDTVIYTARYIRYTTLDLLKDSTRVLPIDTTVTNFQNFSPISQPDNPTVNLGSVGLPYREMLFNPSKSIGFDAGFHSLDAYLLTQDDLHYYRARAPYTELYYVAGSKNIQLFKVTHSQNIKPNWNFGANYFRNGSEGLYKNQQANHLNAAIFTWYESKNKRYNLLANGLFNTLKANENGSVVRDVFNLPDTVTTIGKAGETVRLNGTGGNTPRQIWKQKNIFIKQFYYLGRIDSSSTDTSHTSILPTQRISHLLSYSTKKYQFFKNEEDPYGVFPGLPGISDADDETANLANDSTIVKNLRNEFMYSFYLRGRAVKFIKNEMKLDVGLQHDLYSYNQMGYKTTFQNITLKASPGYRFSNRVYIEGDLQQIVQGRNAGDFLYEANANFLLSKSVGRIVLGAYSQNRSPEEIYERINYQYHNWPSDIEGKSRYNFDRTKINNLSFSYLNPKFRMQAKAEYFLVSDYLYLDEGALPQFVQPRQFGTNINLLKITLKKDFKFGKFNLDNYLVYQKTDFQDLLRTPEFYSYNSFYFSNRYFKVLYADIGFDVRYNTSFLAPSYAVNISQFYNGTAATFSNYPVADVWFRGTLNRANLFFKYNYANQGLFSKGYYTVNKYPMPDALLTFGVSWKFYD
ncbi:putative porin [Rubrolithibacter danxiaensis]|uniref:putative porin n=1 Tax=Rubrolithibacter danxiaensis TaxID=3390805 RepID=UPI003BF7A398